MLTQRSPARTNWPGTHERPRLLVEVPGGRWHAEEAARAAGFQVLACPSVPICVELPSGKSDLDATASKIPRGTSGTVVIGMLERLAKRAPAGGATP
jgi:hypothetical protein